LPVSVRRSYTPAVAAALAVAFACVHRVPRLDAQRIMSHE
jgi:hypothetical protein